MEKNPGRYGIAALAIAALLSAGACDRADNTATGLSEGGSERSAQVSPESAPSGPTASTAPETSSAETAPGPMAGADSAAGQSPGAAGQDAGSGTPGISGYTGPAEGRAGGAEGGTGTAPPGASGSAATGGPAAAGEKSAAGKALSSTDRNFLREAARDSMFEIEVARLAAERANDPQVKSFASRLVDDHTKANEQLQQIARSRNVTLPSELQASTQRKVERLRSATGAEFDKQFLQMVGVRGHKEDIAAFERASRRARDAEIREFARTTLPSLREHLSSAQQLAATVGTGATSPPQGFTGEEGAAGAPGSGTEQRSPEKPSPGSSSEDMGTTTSPQPQGYTGPGSSTTEDSMGGSSGGSMGSGSTQ